MESNKKRSRKSKLVPRECFDSDDENIADMQNEIEQTIARMTSSSILRKLSRQTEEPLKFSIKVEVEEVDEPINTQIKQEESERELNITIDSVISLKEPNTNIKKNKTKVLEKNSSPAAILSKGPDVLQCKFKEEMLREEFDRISKQTTSKADKLIEIHILNFFGRYLNAIELDDKESQLQSVLEKWKTWQKNIPGYRDVPLSYKCYICLKAWWHYYDFRQHFHTHNQAVVDIETFNQECSIVAFQNERPDNEIPIDDNCWRCGQDFKMHQVVKRSNIYRCKGCLEKFISCTLLNQHLGSCHYFKRTLDVAGVKTCDLHPCILCPAKYFSEIELDKHLKTRHSVRSDLPAVIDLKNCPTCNHQLIDTQSHECKNVLFTKSCEFCKRNFRKAFNLQMHQTAGKKHHKCCLCGKILLAECMELEHVLTHSNTYCMVYKCMLCPNPVYFLKEMTVKKHKFACHRRRSDGVNIAFFEMIAVPKTLLRSMPLKIDLPRIKLRSNNDYEESQESINNACDEMEVRVVDYNECDSKNDNTVANVDKFRKLHSDNNIDTKTKIEAVLTNIDKVSTKIYEVTTHSDEVTTNIDKVSTNIDEVTTHSDEVTTNIDKVSTNIDEVTTHSDEVTTNIDKVSTNIDEVTTHSDEVTTTDELSTNIDKVITNIDKVTTNINKVTTNINELSTNIDKVTAYIDELSTNIDGVTTNIDKVLSNIEPLKIKKEKADIEDEECSTEINIKQEPMDIDFNVHNYNEDNINNMVVKEEIVEHVVEICDLSNGIKIEVKDEPTDNDNDLINDSESEHNDTGDDKNDEDFKFLSTSKIYSCRKCPYKGIHRHYKQHIKERCHNSFYTCTKCNSKHHSMKNYLSHFQEHSYSQHTCPKCLKRLATSSELTSHVHQHIKNNFVGVHFIKEKTYNKRFQCRQCRVNVSYSEFFVHWESHVEIKNLEMGSETIDLLKNKPILKRLVGLLQGEAPEISKGLQPKQCVMCLKNFSRKNDLKRHLIEHLLRDAYLNRDKYQCLKCQICSIGFNKNDVYKHHMRDHASLPLYKCEICDKTFSDSSNFSKHKKVHNLSVMVCDICKKKFTCKAFLIKHLEMHDKCKPIVCECCQRVFHSPSAYRKHRNGRNRFKCHVCALSFDALKDKWDHMWLEHKERKYLADCPICKKSFRKYQDVKKHIKTAHDSKYVYRADFVRINNNEEVIVCE